MLCRGCRKMLLGKVVEVLVFCASLYYNSPGSFSLLLSVHIHFFGLSLTLRLLRFPLFLFFHQSNQEKGILHLQQVFLQQVLGICRLTSESSEERLKAASQANSLTKRSQQVEADICVVTCTDTAFSLCSLSGPGRVTRTTFLWDTVLVKVLLLNIYAL